MIHFCRIIIGLCLLISGFAYAAESASTKSNTSPASKMDTPDAAPQTMNQSNPIVMLKTSMGEMTVELYPEKAPETVKNFLKYVDKGFYDGVIFHRIIPNFMVQTGGFSKEYYKKNTMAPIINESNNKLKNLRGTLAMARTNHPDSATAQFFINLVDNDSLDFTPGRMGMPDNQGYAVFGKVTKGIETIDKMAAQPQGKHRTRGYGEFVNAPNEQIIIERAYRVKAIPKKVSTK